MYTTNVSIIKAQISMKKSLLFVLNPTDRPSKEHGTGGRSQLIKIGIEYVCTIVMFEGKMAVYVS